MKSGKRLTTDRKIGICIVRRLFMIRAIGPSKCPSCRVSKELAKLREIPSAYSNTFLKPLLNSGRNLADIRSRR